MTDGSPRLFYGIGDGTDAYHVANGRSSAHKQASQMPNLGQILKSCCTMFKLIDTAWDVLPNTQVVLQCNWMRCVVAVEVGKSKFVLIGGMYHVGSAVQWVGWVRYV